MKANVYILRNAAGEPLYVGCTTYGIQRLAGHRNKPWWHEVATVTLEHLDDRGLALQREAALIAELKPQYNVSPGRPKALTDAERETARQEALARTESAKAKRRARFLENLPNTHYEVPGGIRCANCGWTGRWIAKGSVTEDVKCPTCSLAQLRRGERVA